jgi:hypothetical protein
MNVIKLKSEQLAPYLPYQVKAKFQYNNDKKCRTYVVGTVGVVYSDGSICCFDTVNATPDRFRLILKPISELNSLLEKIYGEFRFQNIDIVTMKYATVVNYQMMGESFKDLVYSQGSFDCCPMYVFNELLKHHLDVFNLIPKKLAIAV